MKTLKNIVSVAIVILAVILFVSIIIFNFAVAIIRDFSTYSMLAAGIASIIPAVFCYSLVVAGIEYVKEEMIG